MGEEMTKDEFIKQYCERSEVSWEELGKFMVALPCNCIAEECQGWAMIYNDPFSIKIHEEFYGPDGKMGR